MYEINRITRPGGYLFLSVSPLYYSGYGSHLRRDGKRLENWEHLDPNSRYYMVSNPLPDAPTEGHFLNKMTFFHVLDDSGSSAVVDPFL